MVIPGVFAKYKNITDLRFDSTPKGSSGLRVGHAFIKCGADIPFQCQIKKNGSDGYSFNREEYLSEIERTGGVVI
jgi:hypothetical protein